MSASDVGTSIRGMEYILGLACVTCAINRWAYQSRNWHTEHVKCLGLCGCYKVQILWLHESVISCWQDVSKACKHTYACYPGCWCVTMCIVHSVDTWLKRQRGALISSGAGMQNHAGDEIRDTMIDMMQCCGAAYNCMCPTSKLALLLWVFQNDERGIGHIGCVLTDCSLTWSSKK